jgi:hypothetical protein
VGIPDFGEPFDIGAYAAELKPFENRESARLIRRAMVELEPRWRQGS